MSDVKPHANGPAVAVLTEKISALDRHLTAQLGSLEDRMDTGDQNLRDHIEAQVGQIKAALDAARRETTIAADAAGEAIKVALASQDKLSASHNDLLRKMEKKDESYVTKDLLNGALKPLTTYVTAQTSGPKAITSQTVVTLLAALGILAGLYFGLGNRNQTAPTTPTVTVTTPAP